MNEAEKLKLALEQANQLLRSTYAIAMREGANTNWQTFQQQVKTVLANQHYLLYPEQYVETKDTFTAGA